MSVDEQSSFFGLNQGCAIHGEEFMRECGMCGVEFCSRCFPRSAVCSECAQTSQDDIDDDGKDFQDVTSVVALLGEDEEIDKILKATDDTPPPDDLKKDKKEDA